MQHVARVQFGYGGSSAFQRRLKSSTYFAWQLSGRRQSGGAEPAVAAEAAVVVAVVPGGRLGR